MNMQLSEQQELLLNMFSKLFANESTLERVQTAEATGFDRELWQTLVEVGAPLLRAPEESGGLGVSLLDAVLVAEQAGKHLASAPLIETIVAASILGRLDTPLASEWLERLGSGESLITLALSESTPGAQQIVPAGSVASGILVLEGDSVYLTQSIQPPARADNVAALPLANVVLSAIERIELASGDAAGRVFRAGVEEWKLLTASYLIGMAREALEEAAAYSRDRLAFGQPIGSYQGLAHPLADSITDVESASQFLRWTLWHLAEGRSEGAAFIPMSFWWAGQTALDASIKSMRVLGGYGVSMEYPSQIFYRRARALTLLAGAPDNELRAAADRLFNDVAVDTPEPGHIHIDYHLGAAADEYAAAARQFFDSNMTPALEKLAYTSDDGYEPEFHALLSRSGFMFPDWPEAYGGQGRSSYETSALFRVYGEYNWSVTVPNTTDMVAKILMMFGGDELKRDLVTGALAGEVNFSLGYSEPSCGSDIFAAKTRAIRDGDDWLLNGQKMFTSQGHLAQYALMVTRTDPEAPKHKGITLFLVPLDDPGYACTEIKTLGGERTNVTFYTDMRIPDKYRLGEVNGGSKVLAAALTLEHSAGDFFLIVMHRLYRDALAWAQETTIDQRPAIDDDNVRRALVRLRIKTEALDAMTRHGHWSNSVKSPQRYHGPMTKLFASEAATQHSAEILELAGSAALLEEPTTLGWVLLENRKSIAGTIYAGTSEVQRSIIAETALGLPRTRN